MRSQYRGVTQSQYNLQVVSNEVKRNFKFAFILRLYEIERFAITYQTEDSFIKCFK